MKTRYHFFLHYGWFLQNLGKNFIRTNMHTTVKLEKKSIWKSVLNTYLYHKLPLKIDSGSNKHLLEPT